MGLVDVSAAFPWLRGWLSSVLPRLHDCDAAAMASLRTHCRSFPTGRDHAVGWARAASVRIVRAPLVSDRREDRAELGRGFSDQCLADACAAGDPADKEARQYGVRRARRLRKAAAVEQVRPLRAARGRRLQQIRTSEALGQGLARLRARAGQPSLREIERATGARGHRPRSTCQMILAGHVLPTSNQLTALLVAFDATGASFLSWRIALNRIVARRHPERPGLAGVCARTGIARAAEVG